MTRRTPRTLWIDKQQDAAVSPAMMLAGLAVAALLVAAAAGFSQPETAETAQPLAIGTMQASSSVLVHGPSGGAARFT